MTAAKVATGNKVGTGSGTPVHSEHPAATPGPASPQTKPKAPTAPKARKAGASALSGAYKGATATSAKRLVLFGVLAAGGAVVLRDLKRGTTPSLRLGVGILFAGIFLSALADVVPEVAGPLGLLVLVGAFVLPGPNGQPSVGADLLSSVRTISKP